MSDTRKRQPVPRVPPVSTRTRNTAHLPGEFPFTEVPKSGPSNKAENQHNKEKITMANATNKIKKLVVDNQSFIKRKVIVAVGATAGLLITGAVVELLNRPKTVNNVIIIEESPDEITDPTSEPLEP